MRRGRESMQQRPGYLCGQLELCEPVQDTPSITLSGLSSREMSHPPGSHGLWGNVGCEHLPTWEKSSSGPEKALQSSASWRFAGHHGENAQGT